MNTICHLPRLGAALAASVLLVTIAGVPPAMASSPAGACTGEDGVTVVVDFTDTGGDILAGCAPLDPSTGREALEAAGFTITESQPGLICAIDARPDPCPKTFDGSFWSYWHSTGAGDWTSYSVGADSSDPVPGELEGWRYNDGSVGPGVAPQEVAASLSPTSAEPTANNPEPAPASASANDALLIGGAGIGALAILACVLLLLRSRRRARKED
jgi:hypothetical protein